MAFIINLFIDGANRRIPYVDHGNTYCLHYVKIVRIGSFSGSYFPAFSPNPGKYGSEKLQIWTLFTQYYFALNPFQSNVPCHICYVANQSFNLQGKPNDWFVYEMHCI